MILNENLRTFLTVAETGSFSKAAERLYISSPAVIKQMNGLEKDLGFPLFVRTHQGVTLTPAGRLMRDEARLVLSHFSDAVENARQLASPPKELRIGTSIFKPFQPFMELWANYANHFPGYSLKIVPFDDDHNTIQGTVASLGRRFDFLAAACDSKAWLSQVSFYKLWDDPLCAAVPLTHRLAGASSLPLSALSGETVYFFQRGEAASMDAAWNALDTHPDIHVIPTGYYDMDLFNRASAEKRIIISIASWGRVHPSFTSIPIEWNLTTPYGLLYAKRPSPAVEKFIACLSEGKNPYRK